MHNVLIILDEEGRLDYNIRVASCVLILIIHPLKQLMAISSGMSAQRLVDCPACTALPCRALRRDVESNHSHTRSLLRESPTAFMQVDCYGNFSLRNAKTGTVCSLYFTPCGWFGTGRYEACIRIDIFFVSKICCH